MKTSRLGDVSQHSRDMFGPFREQSYANNQTCEYNTVKYSRDTYGDFRHKIAETNKIGRDPRTVAIC